MGQIKRIVPKFCNQISLEVSASFQFVQQIILVHVLELAMVGLMSVKHKKCLPLTAFNPM